MRNQDNLQVGQVIGAGVGTYQRNVRTSSLMAAALGQRGRGEGRGSVCGVYPFQMVFATL